ncbi:MAG: hypothetical protein NC821_05050, partial [Candidatus Omnitrophica bacterium]|nr:hypothetical protein [Candidatus Omnitrophota bacterium]
VIWKSSKPIEGVVCEYNTTPVGLIIPKFSSPESIKGNEWFVGVDFGTSNTTVCYKEGKEGVPTLLRFEDRTLKLTRRADVEIKDFFIPRFMPFWEKESFTSIYRILKTGGGGPQSEEMVLDGILLHLDTYPAYPITLTRGDVKPNLKWTTETEERDYILNFLQHLVLLIMAEARANGIKKLTFYSSYPSAFINQWISDLKGNWESGIVQKFKIERGFTINFSEEKFQTESVAACKYWVGKREMAIGGTIASCVFDIGGGTTDIGIWMTTGSKPELKAQASIILAGNILTDFILRDNDFYITLIKLFSENPKDWMPTFEGIWTSSQKGLLVPALINTILKRKKEAEIIGEVRRQAFGAFKKLRTLIMFGGGALLYYLGLLLRDIKREVPLEGCEIFFSGNGSKLLKWICPDTDLFANLRKIIQESADFDPQKAELIKFHYSRDPKEEVARGLLFEEEMGKVEPKKIIGETGYSYQSAVLEWNRGMEAVESMDFSKITVPNEFPELEAYIRIYNQIADDIGLDNMKYQPVFIKNRIEFLLSQVDPKKVELIQPFFIEEVKEVLNRYLQPES